MLPENPPISRGSPPSAKPKKSTRHNGIEARAAEFGHGNAC
jgi:hypothetical protein